MSIVPTVYLILKPLANKTPCSGIVLSRVVLSVPMVLALNNVVPLSGVPSINSITPAVPPDTIENPFKRTLEPLPTDCAAEAIEPTSIFPANCAELVTEVIVLKYLVPSTASADPVEVITSVKASSNTSVPTIVFVFALSLVHAVVTVNILAPPEAKEAFASGAVGSGLAAVTIKSSSAATSSLIN